MKTTQILGIALLVVAGAVGYMGYSESQGLSSALSNVLEGNPGDSVMIKYVAAGVIAAVGVFFIRK